MSFEDYMRKIMSNMSDKKHVAWWTACWVDVPQGWKAIASAMCATGRKIKI